MPACCCSFATKPASAAITALPVSPRWLSHHRRHAVALFGDGAAGRQHGHRLCWRAANSAGADRGARCGKPADLLRLIRRVSSCSSGRCRRCCAGWPARSMCRRSASLTAKCRRPTQIEGRHLGGARRARHAGGACSAPASSTAPRAGSPYSRILAVLLGLMFIVVTLFLPKGVIGLLRRRKTS